MTLLIMLMGHNKKLGLGSERVLGETGVQGKGFGFWLLDLGQVYFGRVVVPEGLEVNVIGEGLLEVRCF